ncbi:MAG: hypothetical protein M3460_25280 [Actinomycetota bacterium]|nr:hypothetical protein [Actinomycetota bacterium]
MPTTPHPADHSNRRDAPAPDRRDRCSPGVFDSAISIGRKEFTINASADSHPKTDPEEPANALYRDKAQCPCGALADRNGPCRKCRARATWNRRQANRERRAVRPSSWHPSSSRRSGRGSIRPSGRRPGH